MRSGCLKKWLLSLALVALALGLDSAPAVAWCAVCYDAAAASGPKAIRALQLGILILLVPTVTILGGLGLVAFRRRNSSPSGDAPSPKPPGLKEDFPALVTSERDAASSPVLNP